MTTEELLEKIQFFESQSFENGCQKPDGLDEFLSENWVPILFILKTSLSEEYSNIINALNK